MTKLSDEFRQKSKDQATASAALFEEADFGDNAKKQALAVIGQVNSTIYSALADMMDSGRHSALADSLESRLKFNAAVRMAAANGDSNEFDRLVSAAGAIDGGGAAPANGAATGASGPT